MTAGDWAWGGLLATGAGVELWALHNGRRADTLSECTRTWCRVRTPTGRIVFAAGWRAFATWFLIHILEA